MKLRCAWHITAFALVAVSLFAADVFGQYGQRSLLEKKIYYVTEGKINSCDYWSLPIGRFTCTIRRYYPGQDTIPITSDMNFSLLSNGYIEGNGYSDKGKTGAEGEFAIDSAEGIKKVGVNDIDFVYQNGSKVKLKDGSDVPLYLYCEGNKFTVSQMKIMIWRYDTFYKELKHLKDVDGVTAFSFTKEGALRSLKAANR
ncbi:MAG: hypothetical protein JW795_22850 [Chitinivibrionales bacterium]|nr:hypothetical protein [Chitinivibrionales bacterium]